jgi:hypothetical protein
MGRLPVESTHLASRSGLSANEIPVRVDPDKNSGGITSSAIGDPDLDQVGELLAYLREFRHRGGDGEPVNNSATSDESNDALTR